MAEAYGSEPVRVVLCTCGWAGRYTTLAAANREIERHKAEGTEGCDHAVRIEEQGSPR